MSSRLCSIAENETSPPSASLQAGYLFLQRFHASEAYPTSPSELEGYVRGVPAFHTFAHSDGCLPGNTLGSIKFYKDYGEQRIEVVAKQNEKREWVILSCWSKIVGNGRPIFPQKESLFWSLTKKIAQKIWEKFQKK